MRFQPNVSLVSSGEGRKPRVFVDCLQMKGVVDAAYEAKPGEQPVLTLRVVMPLLGQDKPRVRRKCLTRPHVPATGGIARLNRPYLVGENTSDYCVSREMAKQMGIVP